MYHISVFLYKSRTNTSASPYGAANKHESLPFYSPYSSKRAGNLMDSFEYDDSHVGLSRSARRSKGA